MFEKDNGWSKKRPLHLNIGMIVSLALVLIAFEWQTVISEPIITEGSLEPNQEEQLDIPIQYTPPPPPPPKKIVNPKIEVVEDDVEDDIAEIITEIEEDESIPVPMDLEPEPEPEEEEVVETIFYTVQEGAAPEEGLKKFYKFIGKSLKYPRQARRLGIEGKVYVQFTVEKDGSLTDLKIIKGIGAGCDEEAMRVLQLSPKWKPAKNRGREVRQRMIFPFSFKLGRR